MAAAPVRACSGGSSTAACLEALGDQHAHALYYRAPLHRLPVLPLATVLGVAVASAETGDPVTPRAALALVAATLRRDTATADLSVDSARRMAAEMSALTMYLAEGCKVTDVRRVRPDQVSGWVAAPTKARRGRPSTHPSVATRYLRRSAARLYFRMLRRLGVLHFDPTLDLTLPPRMGPSTRVLDDTELTYLRFLAGGSAVDTDRASALALTEATASHQELPRVRPCDIDRVAGTVALSGGKGTRARRVPLSAWGLEAVQASLLMHDALGRGYDEPLLHRNPDPDSASARTTCSALLQGLLVQADLTHAEGYRPRSIMLWRPARVLAETGSLDLAVRCCGSTRYDKLAEALGHDPHQPDPRADSLVAQVVASNAPCRASRTDPSRRTAPTAPASPPDAKQSAARRRRGRPRKPVPVKAVKNIEETT